MSSPALPHPIDRFVVNRGDTEKFLASFPNDGVVIDSGGASRVTMPSRAGATASSSRRMGG
jgi:hypothetical protein